MPGSLGIESKDDHLLRNARVRDRGSARRVRSRPSALAILRRRVIKPSIWSGPPPHWRKHLRPLVYRFGALRMTRRRQGAVPRGQIQLERVRYRRYLAETRPWIINDRGLAEFAGLHDELEWIPEEP